MSTNEWTIDPSEGRSRQVNQQLSRRTDLADAIGIIVTLPDHVRDREGNVQWGASSRGGNYDQAAYNEFQQMIAHVPDEIVGNEERVPEFHRATPVHHYETGPAAQTWPQFALLLWEHAEPILTSGVLLVETGRVVRQVVDKLKDWYRETNAELARTYQYDPTQPYHRPNRVEFQYALTQGSAIALAAEDVQTRHAVAPPFTIHSFVRGFPGYADAKHPSWSTSYLVQCHTGRRSFIYHFNPGGELSEHYLMFGSDITPLPFPPKEDGQPDAFHTSFAGLQLTVH